MTLVGFIMEAYYFHGFNPYVSFKVFTFHLFFHQLTVYSSSKFTGGVTRRFRHLRFESSYIDYQRIFLPIIWRRIVEQSILKVLQIQTFALLESSFVNINVLFYQLTAYGSAKFTEVVTHSDIWAIRFIISTLIIQ